MYVVPKATLFTILAFGRIWKAGIWSEFRWIFSRGEIVHDNISICFQLCVSNFHLLFVILEYNLINNLDLERLPKMCTFILLVGPFGPFTWFFAMWWISFNFGSVPWHRMNVGNFPENQIVYNFIFIGFGVVIFSSYIVIILLANCKKRNSFLEKRSNEEWRSRTRIVEGIGCKTQGSVSWRFGFLIWSILH